MNVRMIGVRHDELLEEAMGLKGMMAEIQAKARLWSFKTIDEKQRQFEIGEVEPTREFVEQAEHAADQMEEDLAKYSHRLFEICEELENVVP